jgi:hypothetical protein
MTQYRLACTSGEAEATIVLADGGLFSFPTWQCVEGNAVWGAPSSGDCLSPRLTGGQIELSLGSVIDDWSTDEDASGSGYRLSDNGGSFPAGDFAWKRLPG